MNGQTVMDEIARADRGLQEARKRLRIILLVAVAATIVAFVSNSVLLGVAMYVITAMIAGSYAVAMGQGRSPALLGSLFLPVIGPLIVAFFPDPASKHPGAVVLSRLARAVGLFSASIKIMDDQLILKSIAGISRRIFNLADLRLLYLIIPGDFKWQFWKLTSSSQAMQYVALDLLSEKSFAELKELLVGLVRERKASGVQLVLAGYRGEAAVISLSRLGRDPGLIEAIARTRPRRLEKLKRWLGENPRVIMKKLTLTASGIEQKKGTRPWEDIETFQTLTQNGMITSITMILKETKVGRFTGKERHLQEQLIYSLPPSRKEWYSAELFFWTQFADDREVLKGG